MRGAFLTGGPEMGGIGQDMCGLADARAAGFGSCLTATRMVGPAADLICVLNAELGGARSEVGRRDQRFAWRRSLGTQYLRLFVMSVDVRSRIHGCIIAKRYGLAFLFFFFLPWASGSLVAISVTAAVVVCTLQLGRALHTRLDYLPVCLLGWAIRGLDGRIDCLNRLLWMEPWKWSSGGILHLYAHLRGGIILQFS